MKYCLRGLLGVKQRKTLFHFCDICTKLFSESHDKSNTQNLIKEVNLTLAMLERDFPITIQVSYH